MSNPAFIDRSQVHEWDTHKFVADASDLGWPPGHFPLVVDTNLGNGQPLVRQDSPFGRGIGITFRQLLGCISLTVHND